MKCKCNLPLF